MPWGIFFANQDDENDKGFKDSGSNITYNNESKQEALDKASWFEEYGSGSDIRTSDGQDPRDCSDDSRFNTTILNVDDEGFYYPEPHSPGK